MIKKDTETTWYNKSNISSGINPSIDKIMENKKESKYLIIK